MDQQVARRPWLLAVATAIFDLDLGQQLEVVQPEDALSDEEKSSIAYCAFPDSMSQDTNSRSSVKDSTFFFRVRRTNGKDDDTVSYLYCFAFCRQRQDERLRRGGDQRTSLLISLYPYSSILSSLVQVLGPALLTHGAKSAAQVLEHSRTVWPPPIPGRVMHFPVVPVPVSGRVCPDMCLPEQPEVELPTAPHTGLLRLSSVPTPMALSLSGQDNSVRSQEPSSGDSLPRVSIELSKPPVGVFFELDMFSPFSTYLHRLWELWELMLMAQPLMVFARSPHDASNVVGALISLITPLPYAPDFRPLLTIHDPQIKDIQNNVLHSSEHPVPTVFGVTNPYFLRCCERCPNVMAVPLGGSTGGGTAALGRSKSQANSLLSRLTPSAVFKSLFTRSQRQGLLEDQSEGVWMSYRALGAGPDRDVLKLMKEIPSTATPAKAASIAAQNSSLLRIHLFQLTSAFLTPFYHYYRIPVPWATSPPPFQDEMATWTSELPGFFHVADFISYLEKIGVPEEVKSYCGSAARAHLLYIRFIQSLNFVPWLCRVLEEAGLGSLLQDAASETEGLTPGGLTPANDVQLIEEWARLEEQLQAHAGPPESLHTPPPPTEAPTSYVRSVQSMPMQTIAERPSLSASLAHSMPRESTFRSPLTFHFLDDLPAASEAARQRADASGEQEPSPTGRDEAALKAASEDAALMLEPATVQLNSREGSEDDTSEGAPQESKASLSDLRTAMQGLLAKMPEDLQLTLLTSPARKTLLRQFDVIE